MVINKRKFCLFSSLKPRTAHADQSRCRRARESGGEDNRLDFGLTSREHMNEGRRVNYRYKLNSIKEPFHNNKQSVVIVL